jgi:nitrate/nitrite transport system ATP-binding protein
MSTPALQLQHVRKGFPRDRGRIEVLDEINLIVDPGEFVAIVGFSGSGKTTLISLLAGLLLPDAGVIRHQGEPITGPSLKRGVVFQNYSLLPWLTVRENVALGVDQAFPNWPQERRREQIEEFIALVNLTPAMHKRPAELSGGMRQRVAVARALAMDPEILLLDEPLGALDALTRATLQDEIAQIWRRDRKTVVLITNDLDEALLLADRIIPLTAGPKATLGPSFLVAADRPRGRKAIAKDADFRQLRRDITHWLLNDARGKPSEPARPVNPEPRPLLMTT